MLQSPDYTGITCSISDLPTQTLILLPCLVAQRTKWVNDVPLLILANTWLTLKFYRTRENKRRSSNLKATRYCNLLVLRPIDRSRLSRTASWLSRPSTTASNRKAPAVQSSDSPRRTSQRNAKPISRRETQQRYARWQERDWTDRKQGVVPRAHLDLSPRREAAAIALSTTKP